MTSIDLGKSFEKFKETIKPKNMINPELYNKTVDILVQAYFNDTLQHGNCAACAVGNIVASNCGYSFIGQTGALNWKEVPAYVNNVALNWFCVIGMRHIPNERTKYEIESTGYSTEELQLIEGSFEHAKKGNSEDQYMFNGLMAVVDVLDNIHENTNTELSQTTKARFKKQLA